MVDGQLGDAMGASVGSVRLVPDVDYSRMPADLSAGEQADPDAVGEWLAWAWSASYRSQVPDSLLLEFDDVATFLFDQASGAGAAQADRTIAAQGLSRPARCRLPAGLPLAGGTRGTVPG